jgi:hypothetical protein
MVKLLLTPASDSATVPEISPLEAFKLSPEGRVPEITEYVKAD